MRSNARRHLRTHGVPAPPSTSSQTAQPTFTMGFDAPVVSAYGSQAIPKLEWVQQKPMTLHFQSGSNEEVGGANSVQPSSPVFGAAQEYIGAPHHYRLSEAGSSAN